jgi:hypothetical protein
MTGVGVRYTVTVHEADGDLGDPRGTLRAVPGPACADPGEPEPHEPVAGAGTACSACGFTPRLPRLALESRPVTRATSATWTASLEVGVGCP